MENKISAEHQVVLNSLVNKIHNLQDADDKLKFALIEYLQKNIRQSIRDFNKIFIYANGLVSTGMGWDEVYVNFLNRFGYSNLTYQQFNALSESEQNDILKNTDIAKVYFQIFTE